MIVLTEVEQRLARYLAQARFNNNRSAKVQNRRIGNQSNAETDLDGVGAELAAAKILNAYPDLTITPRSGGYDLVVRGRTLDVKTTHYPKGLLIAVRHKQVSDADMYLLMVGSFPSYEARGWAYASELLSDDNLTDLGHGLTYALPQDKLRPLEQLDLTSS